MQIQIKTIKTACKRKFNYCENVILVVAILLPLVLITFYPNHLVFAQNEKQTQTSQDVLICQMSKYIESPTGPNTQQVTNICSHQNSIGYDQSLSELCFMFSGKSIDIINSYCDKVKPTKVSTSVMNEAPLSVNEKSTSDLEELAPIIENDQKSDNQNNTDNGLKVTIFDGVAKFFSGVFNP
jgi:hypothetical protein